MHHTTLALIAAGLPLALATASLSAAELHVPAGFATIQAAIDAAAPADHVVLADGVYAGPGNVGLDFGGKAITVRSANGAAGCIIDGTGSPGANAFVFDSDETSQAHVEGLTFEHFVTGKSNAGAIRITEASPRILDCVFRNCTTAPARLATPPGSAIHMTAATPLVQRCRFESNEGSAVLVGAGSVVYVIDCTFEDNTARSDDGIGGGAVQNHGFTLIFFSLLRGNAVEAIAGPARGGAVAHVGLLLDLTTNTFEANRVSGPAATEGAAVYAAADFILNAGTFRGHAGDHDGAAMLVDGSTLDAPIAVMNLGVARIGVTATEAVTLDFRARRNGDGPVHHAPVDAGGH